MTSAAAIAIIDEAAAAERAATRLAWFGFAPMVFGYFLAIVDIQIVASSINEIQSGLSASASEIQWIQTAYLIAEIIAIPLSGYLSRLMSTRIYFTACTLGFTLASVGCAFAWNLSSMVAFRVVQGFMGGGMIPTVSAASFMMFTGQHRLWSQVLIGVVATMGSTIGPTIGGYLTQHLSWHWLFLVNFVPGMLISVLVWRLVHIDRPQRELWSLIDIPGIVLMAIFLGGFQYVLDEGPRHDWFADRGIAVVASITLVGAVGFFWRVLTTPHPIVDIRVFADRNFAFGCIMITVMGAGIYMLTYLLPLFLGQVRGYNPVQIGNVMAIQGLTMMMVAPIVTRLLQVTGVRPVMLFGILLFLAGVWTCMGLTADWGFDQFLIPQILRAAGLIIWSSALFVATLGSLSQEELKNGSGIFNVMRNLGGAIGLATIATLLNQANWQHWQELSGLISSAREPVREALAQAGGGLAPELGADASLAALQLIAQQVQQQVAVLSFRDLYADIFWITLLIVPLVPFIGGSRKGAPAAAVEAMH